MNTRFINTITVLVCLASCFVLFGLKARAQPGAPDQARSIHFLQPPKSPTTELFLIEQYLKLGAATTHTDTAIYYFEKAALLSKQFVYTAGLAKSYKNLAVAYRKKDDPDRYEMYLEQALKQEKILGQDSLVQDHILALTYSLLKSGKYDAVLRQYHLGKSYFTDAMPQKQAMLCNVIANVYFQSGYLDSAITIYRNGIRLWTDNKLKDYRMLFDLNIGLGSVYFTLKIMADAEKYYTAAQTLAREQKDTVLIATALHHMGALYSDTRDYDRSLAVCLQGLSLARTQNDLETVSSCASCVGLAYINKDAAGTALPYNEEAYRTAGFASVKLGAAYLLGLNYAMTGAYHKAEELLVTSIATARKNNMVYNITNAYEALATTYAGLKQYDKAYEYQSLLTRIRDSLIGKENSEKVALLEQQFKAAEKDKQLTQQQMALLESVSKMKQKNMLIALVVVSALLAVLLLVVRQKNKQRFLQQQQELAYMQERMKGEEMERGRIAQELHDGVSILISAAKMTHTTIGRKYEIMRDTEEYEELSMLLGNTAQELRNISQNLVPEQLVRQSLPAAIQSFCTLIEKGHGIEIEVQHFGQWSHFSVEYAYTIYRMVQELIHNVVKHAAATKAIVLLLTHEDLLSLTVEDNGKGFEHSNPAKGMGLKNIQKRIEAVGGKFTIQSNAQTGTVIEIELLINQNTTL